jgi:hypothetical protein
MKLKVLLAALPGSPRKRSRICERARQLELSRARRSCALLKYRSRVVD